jgi:predicted adenine nucleotide alpha hydrolase (AANH) superfamily ATPase
VSEWTKDERNGADRCWIWRDSFHYPQVSFARPDPKVHPSVEYMRVLSRAKVENTSSAEAITGPHNAMSAAEKKTFWEAVRGMENLAEAT